jgi:hypothetical protein
MIAIKDMKMPSTCYKCDFCHIYNYENIDACNITEKYISDGKNKRDDNCPLVDCKDCTKGQRDIVDEIRAEIADLADADAYGDYQMGFNIGLVIAAQIIDKYKTEAESDGEE